MTELKGFKFVATLLLQFKKMENEDKINIVAFIQNQKQKNC